MAAGEWIVFDAYGTLFDLETSVRRGDRAQGADRPLERGARS